ncbi:MAG: hypothetical protein DRP90_06535 [Planctomycetota bacterium]|nr:MAG: hypothetical protein DRP90_06535 [Planctomycetota bacterium]
MNGIVSKRWTFAILLTTFFAVGLFSLFRPPSAPAEVFLSKTVRIANPTFRTVSDPEQPVKGWLFKLRKQGAAVLAPHSGKGAILMAASPKARGELLSSSFRLKPFRVVTVTLTWTVELGSPVLFACLRPAKDRFHVDLDFFPRVKPGRTRTASVTLHAGTWGKDYCIAIAVTGTGAARLTGVKVEKSGFARRPEKPALVLDMMRDAPRKDGSLGWPNIMRLATVLGFPSVEHLHFTEFTAEALKKADPSLIVLSPSSRELNKPDRTKVGAALRVAARSGLPVVGICLGHQWFARFHGSRVVSGKEWGTFRIKVVKDDPLFRGLPRLPFFYASESHNYMVDRPPSKAVLLASSDTIKCQVFRYKGKPWYTFQCHIERGWEDDCPEGCVLFKNLVRIFRLAR